jgi:hypothetical protein
MSMVFVASVIVQVILFVVIGFSTVNFAQSGSCAQSFSATHKNQDRTTIDYFHDIQSAAVDGFLNRHTSALHPPLAWMSFFKQSIYRLSAIWGLSTGGHHSLHLQSYLDPLFYFWPDCCCVDY